MKRKGGLFFLFAFGALVGGVLEFLMLRSRHQIEAGALRSELSVARRQARELERTLESKAQSAPSRIPLDGKAKKAVSKKTKKTTTKSKKANGDIVATVIETTTKDDIIIEPPDVS